MQIKIKLRNVKTGKEFYKYFETEFEKDKYIRRIKYFKNLILVDDCKEIICD